MKTAKELKQQVLTDLNTILEMSISEVENNTGEKPEGMKTEDYLFCNQEFLPETWELKHEQLSFSFPGSMIDGITKMVKSKFPEGKTSKHKNKTRKWNDLNGKDFQICVMEMREDFYGKEYLTDKQNLDSRRGVIQKYKKSVNGDLIRLCWKFITDQCELEGVHFAWVNPVAKYEPIMEEAA